jgi:hypothetical protein
MQKGSVTITFREHPLWRSTSDNEESSWKFGRSTGGIRWLSDKVKKWKERVSLGTEKCNLRMLVFQVWRAPIPGHSQSRFHNGDNMQNDTTFIGIRTNWVRVSGGISPAWCLDFVSAAEGSLAGERQRMSLARVYHFCSSCMLETVGNDLLICKLL